MCKMFEKFENDVKMYGTQTMQTLPLLPEWFENDVKMYGTQTTSELVWVMNKFENDVKMYGTQTLQLAYDWIYRLRMM